MTDIQRGLKVDHLFLSKILHFWETTGGNLTKCGERNKVQVFGLLVPKRKRPEKNRPITCFSRDAILSSALLSFSSIPSFSKSAAPVLPGFLCKEWSGQLELEGSCAASKHSADPGGPGCLAPPLAPKIFFQIHAVSQYGFKALRSRTQRPFTSDSRGPWGLAPLVRKISGNFEGKTHILSKFWAQGPLGVKTPLSPPDQNP